MGFLVCEMKKEVKGRKRVGGGGGLVGQGEGGKEGERGGGWGVAEGGRATGMRRIRGRRRGRGRGKREVEGLNRVVRGGEARGACADVERDVWKAWFFVEGG